MSFRPAHRMPAIGDRSETILNGVASASPFDLSVFVVVAVVVVVVVGYCD